MDKKIVTLINENGQPSEYEILDEQNLNGKNYIVAYPTATEEADGLVVIYREENGRYVPEDHYEVIEKIYAAFQEKSTNIKFVDDADFIKKGEVVEFNNKKYICFKVIEFEGEVFTYFISNSKPVDIKFAKQVFNDGEEPQIQIIGDFYEKEKALALLEKSKKGE